MGRLLSRVPCAWQLDWSLANEPTAADAEAEQLSPTFCAEQRCKIFLGYTSNMVSSGVREQIRYLVQHRMVDVLVTSAGGVEEDLIKVPCCPCQLFGEQEPWDALPCHHGHISQRAPLQRCCCRCQKLRGRGSAMWCGSLPVTALPSSCTRHSHPDGVQCLAPSYLGSWKQPGAQLRAQGLNRIGNMLVPNSNYCAFEDWLMPILDAMLLEQAAGIHWTPSKVLPPCSQSLQDSSDDGLSAELPLLRSSSSGWGKRSTTRIPSATGLLNTAFPCTAPPSQTARSATCSTFIPSSRRALCWTWWLTSAA